MDALLDDNGKVSSFKVGQATALVVSTWGFVVLVQQDKLTEWYYTAYMTVWAGVSLAKNMFNTGAQNASTNKG
jgi:hypothetical protein